MRGGFLFTPIGRLWYDNAMKRARFYIRQMLYLYAQQQADKHMGQYNAWRNEFSEWFDTPEGEAMAKDTLRGAYAEIDLRFGELWQNIAYQLSPMVNP